MPTTSRVPVSRLSSALAASKLSDGAVTARVIAAVTPLAVVAGVVPGGIAATGKNSFPVVTVLIGVVFAVFSVSHLAAARRLSPADAGGGFTGIIGRGLGGPAGVGAGWVATLSYAILPIGLYGMVGGTVTPLLNGLFAVHVPWQLVAVPVVLLVGGLGLAHIATSTRVLVVLVVGELLMIAVVTAGNWLRPAPGELQPAALDPRLFSDGFPVAVAQLTLGVLGYIGTELTVLYTRDARHGHRSIARATIAVITTLTLLYFFCSASLTVTLGPGGLLASAQADPGAVLATTTRANIGDTAAIVLGVLTATSLVAGAIAFHGATARYAYFLGRHHAAPAAFARPSRSYSTPILASVSQTVLALAAIVVVSVSGVDPARTLFYVGGSAASVGILILLALTALATTVLFARARDRWWLTTSSAVSAIVLFGLASAAVAGLDSLLGVPADSEVPASLRIAYAVVFTGGAVRAWWLRRRSGTRRRPGDHG
jgi:amino acid transporter